MFLICTCKYDMIKYDIIKLHCIEIKWKEV